MRLAIFDIDGTIFRSSLVIQLCFALVEKKVFPKSSLKEIEKEYLAWQNRQGSYEAYINKVVKIYVKHIKGKKFKVVKRVADMVIKAQKDRVYRYTRDLIKKLKKQNYFLVAVSGSPDYIVESYAKAIGFNACFGTRLEVLRGKFTGKIVNLDSAFNKRKVILELIKNIKYSTSPLVPPQILGRGDNVVDWKKSTAIGDTEGDVNMLKLVGRPIAFNPNMNLLKKAKKQGWEIVVERKDAIYRIGEFKSLT